MQTINVGPGVTIHALLPSNIYFVGVISDYYYDAVIVFVALNVLLDYDCFCQLLTKATCLVMQMGRLTFILLLQILLLFLSPSYWMDVSNVLIGQYECVHLFFLNVYPQNLIFFHLLSLHERPGAANTTWDSKVSSEDMEEMWNHPDINKEWSKSGEKRGKVRFSHDAEKRPYVSRVELRVRS